VAPAAAAVFGAAWLETYGLTIEAEVTDVVGTFSAAFWRYTRRALPELRGYRLCPTVAMR